MSNIIYSMVTNPFSFFVVLLIIISLVVIIIYNVNSKSKKKDTKIENKPQSLSPEQIYWQRKKYNSTYEEIQIEKMLNYIGGYKCIIMNPILTDRIGKTTEIDIIMLHETGIYVIESKDYSGWIFGDQYRKKWTQSLPNKQKFYFYNPIMQNYNHIVALKLLFGSQFNYYNVVIFGSNCTLKNVSTKENVIIGHKADTIAQINNMAVTLPKTLTKEKIDELRAVAFKYCDFSYAKRQEHIKNVSELQKNL